MKRSNWRVRTFCTLLIGGVLFASIGCSSSGRSLYAAASNGESRATAVRFIEGGSDVNQANSSTGWTPLQVAAANGHSKMCQTLIEHGANVNVQDRNGMTPLHLANAGGHTKTTGVLRAAGADTTIRNNVGKTPEQMATD